MRLNKIDIDRLGPLENVCLDDIPGLSVIHTTDCSGSTALVEFVRNTLLSPDSLTTPGPSETQIGSMRISEGDHSWTLSRYRTVTGQQQTTVRTANSTAAGARIMPRVSEWISDRAFHEVLCPGHKEADRFTLLTQLCLAGDDNAGSEQELRRVREAITQAVLEREGSEQVYGVARQITDLERQRDAMNSELDNLKRQDPADPQELDAVEEHVARLQTRNREVETELERVREEISNLERQIRDLRERNRLSLDQDHLRSLLANLASRRNRWSEIRSSIEQMNDEINRSEVPVLNRSGHSVRALVTRLEARMQRGCDDQAERWRENVEQEVAALCRFVTQQHEAARACEQHLESQLSREASNAIQRVESELQSRMKALQEDLDRADDVLSDILHDGSDHCDSAWHQRFQDHHGSSVTGLNSLESQLRPLLDRQSSLLAESNDNSKDLRRMTVCLDELRSQRRTIPSLEEVDGLHARLAEIEARLELLVSRREVLKRTEHTLVQVLTHLSQSGRPAVLEAASPWLRNLTDGECVRVLADAAESQLLVETTTSDQPLRVSQLNRVTQHQLALVLRLVLLQTLSETSTRMPLMIDDVFITSDDVHGIAAADLLRDFAADGQQIIFMTSHSDVRDLLVARGARVYSLSADVEPDYVPDLITPVLSESEPSLVFKAFDGVAEECPGELEDTVVTSDTDSNWLFYLEPDHSVSSLSGLELSERNGFAAVGIESAEELLTCSIADVKEGIQNAGFPIAEDRLRELQTQAVMAVCVPMLRQRDAELLVAAGIDSVRQLVRLRPEAIQKLVERFQRSDAGTRFLRSGRTIDQQQAISWNRWAFHSRTVDRARAAATARQSRIARPGGILSAAQSGQTSRGSRGRRNRHSSASQRRRVRARAVPDSRLRNERRRQRRKRSESTSGPASVQPETELKFYLSLSSDVEAAPSICARTAARLARVGVATVNDLLESNADTLATLLDNRQITASVIEQWKSQSALVCTIPKLRGHDAQILVACGKNDADEIADLSPDQLLSIVEPFCETTEGGRVVWGGQKPDLRKVADWISWARQSRPLKAA